MVKDNTEQMRAWQEYRREQEQLELGVTRKIVDFVGVWHGCENRACRRKQGCTDPRACGERYKEEILRIQREYLGPALRERYPTVQFGAPASVVEAQLEAARAAEEEENARREDRVAAAGDADPKPRRRKKRVAHQPLYDPGDV